MSVDINPIINVDNPDVTEFKRLIKCMYKHTYLRTEQLSDHEYELKFDLFQSKYRPNSNLDIELIPGFARFDGDSIIIYKVISIDINDCPYVYDFVRNNMPHIYEYILAEKKFTYDFHISEKIQQYTGDVQRTVKEIQQKMNYVNDINSKYMLLFINIVRHFYMGEELKGEFKINNSVATLLNRLKSRVRFENICEHDDVTATDYKYSTETKTNVRDNFRNHHKISVMNNIILLTQNFNQYQSLPEFRILDILVRCGTELDNE